MTDHAALTEPFDLLGPLPQGTTVLEASAGTGKTFTIAGLVARYVAEGVVTMDELLVVSFSRESTRELRERVRERLVSARDGLRPAAPPVVGDTVLAHLTSTDVGELALRRRRLEDALAVFDSATVTTTHGFCQQVLTALGTAADHDPGAMLVEDTGDLVAEVADDLYLRKWGRAGAERPSMSRGDFHQLARAVTGDPATRLVPDPSADGMPGLRAGIAGAVRAELERRKRRQHLVDYDDILLRLAATLTDPGSGPAARERLRARYRVVLVDEFQDTDPVQWTILREAFHGVRTLVLIGDPKQAIYGFRGADVHAYLQAKESARSVHTLPTNWRSDAALLDGLAAVFGGAALGDPRIRVLPVTAAYQGALVDVGAPVRLKVLPRTGFETVRGGTVKTGVARAAVAADLGAEVVSLLSTARLRPRDGGDTRRGDTRRLLPGDVAVLVRTNSQAQQVQSALRTVGVPVVVTGRTSVFATPAAQEWQLLLEAIEQPHRTTRVRRLALGCFVGRSAAQLDDLGDAYADDLAQQVRSWGTVLQDRGVAALFEAVSVAQRTQPRVLGQQDGERLMTDLRHIAQVLHAASLDTQLGCTALLTWLRRRREQAAGGGQDSSRRLESDQAAVQVITVHTSKGLEFPVVLVPFAWDLHNRDDPATAAFHDELDERLRDVGGKGGPAWSQHAGQHKQEEVDDELRLTYVALTRAQSHLVLWWAPSFNTPTSPLQRLLLHDDPSTVAPLSIKVPDDAAALAAFRARAAGSPLAVEVVVPQRVSPWSPPTTVPAPLTVAAFIRPLDTAWRRTSYSALTASAHELRLGSEPEVVAKDDESDVADVVAPVEPGDEALRAVGSAWDQLVGGTAFGTLVHAVLEQAPDHADPDTLLGVVSAQARRVGSDVDAAALTAALVVALGTPLGPLAGGAALQDVAVADQLSELDFELPLAGGDEPTTGRVLLGALVPLWREHVPVGPLSSYADALAGLEPAPLRGYLTGSIDAVLRVGAGVGRRYLVVDYKTNRLGARGDQLTAWHYRPAALESAMVEAHYPLQALLYDIALHRYLRWRQPGYDPALHLGGVLYLFLRGMSGPGVVGADGSVPGVFAWRPPSALVTAASDLLAGRR